MACFAAPAAEAVVTTILKKKTEGKETSNPFVKRLGLLNNMLWGGSALLFFEHVWHGEIVPFFPFLTSANPQDASAMLFEMATSGVGMAVLVTGVWAAIALFADSCEKKPLSEGEMA